MYKMFLSLSLLCADLIKVCLQHFSLCQPCSLFVLPHFHSCALTSASVRTDCLVLISHQGLDEKARAPLYCVSADKLTFQDLLHCLFVFSVLFGKCLCIINMAKTRLHDG